VHYIQYKNGGKQIFIDEIHKYKDWSVELKNIYDFYPGLKVCFTGSSILDIRKGMADLSRRALMFSMQGFSFREYLHKGYYPMANEDNLAIRLGQIRFGKS
jgi:predicted AAA+ superfamily ATPase